MPPVRAKLSGHLRSLHQQVTALSDDLQRIAYRLHPSVLDDLGLAPALEAYVRDFSEREHIQATFMQNNVPGSVSADVALCLYRILQEGLRNISQHSSARTAQVRLIGTEATLQLIVKDFGTGFDVETTKGHGGLGLRSMEERAHMVGGTL